VFYMSQSATPSTSFLIGRARQSRRPLTPCIIGALRLLTSGGIFQIDIPDGTCGALQASLSVFARLSRYDATRRVCLSGVALMRRWGSEHLLSTYHTDYTCDYVSIQIVKQISIAAWLASAWYRVLRVVLPAHTAHALPNEIQPYHTNILIFIHPTYWSPLSESAMLQPVSLGRVGPLCPPLSDGPVPLDHSTP